MPFPSGSFMQKRQCPKTASSGISPAAIPRLISSDRYFFNSSRPLPIIMRSNCSENLLWNCPVKLSATSSPAGSEVLPRRVSTTLRQVLAKFSEFFVYWIRVPSFPQEMSLQDRLETTIGNSVDPQHPRFCRSSGAFRFFKVSVVAGRSCKGRVELLSTC